MSYLPQPFFLGLLTAVALMLGAGYVCKLRRRLAYRRRLEARLAAIAALPSAPRS